QKKLKVR
ncbi:Phage terminase large subunit (GpA), partial [Haemophilus influenzae]